MEGTNSEETTEVVTLQYIITTALKQRKCVISRAKSWNSQSINRTMLKVLLIQIICFTGVYIADFSVADHKHKTMKTLKNWSKFHFCPG